MVEETTVTREERDKKGIEENFSRDRARTLNPGPNEREKTRLAVSLVKNS